MHSPSRSQGRRNASRPDRPSVAEDRRAWGSDGGLSFGGGGASSDPAGRGFGDGGRSFGDGVGSASDSNDWSSSEDLSFGSYESEDSFSAATSDHGGQSLRTPIEDDDDNSAGRAAVGRRATARPSARTTATAGLRPSPAFPSVAGQSPFPSKPRPDASPSAISSATAARTSLDTPPSTMPGSETAGAGSASASTRPRPRRSARMQTVVPPRRRRNGW